MAKLEALSVRLAPDEIDRLTAIAERLSARAGGAHITRSSALRVVVEAGLVALETKYAAAKEER